MSIPIQLIINNKDSFEISNEAIKLLYSLKNQKLVVLSINGLAKTGKSKLANDLISNENGFNSNESTKGLWLWSSPIDLDNNIKLLILDCEGIQDNNINKYTLLSILFSTHFIYNTKGDLTDDLIKIFINNLNVTNSVDIKNSNTLPEIIFINDIFEDSEIKDKIEKNDLYINSNFKSLFKSQKYFGIKNINKLLNSIKEEENLKCFDGEILFGIIQNIINCMNHNEKINYDLSIENALLHKAMIECDNTFEEYKTELYKKIEYPTIITNIYKIFGEIQNNYINSFGNKMNNILTPMQLSEYINRLNSYMEKEINYIINKNNEYYENFFLLQYQDFQKILLNSDINNSDNFNDFIIDYCGKFDNCLQKFFSIFTNSDISNKSFINILIKIYQEFIVDKFIKISGKINDIFNKKNDEYMEEINNLKINMDNINEQMKNKDLLIEEKNKEKGIINKNYFELETKFDKFNREYKMKIKEYENNLNIEIQKYKKMENYYVTQLKEKERAILNLENKVEKYLQDIQSINKQNTIKINEFNRENNRLLNEIQRIKEIKNRNKGDFMGGDKNINIPSLLKTVNKSFLDFKESVDNLNKENEDLQKKKYLELSTQEIETKLNNVLSDIKNYCEIQINSVSNNYEKVIKQMKNQCDELNFELSKKNFALNEQILLKETYEKKYNESNNSINQLKNMVTDKENLIKTQNNSFEVYKQRINDSEMKMAETIVELKMKEDEFESLFMLIENIVAKNKSKFEHDLCKISPEAQDFLKTLVKQYRFFK